MVSKKCSFYPCGDWDKVKECGDILVMIEEKERDYLEAKLEESGLILPFPLREATNLDLVKVLLDDYSETMVRVGMKLVFKE